MRCESYGISHNQLKSFSRKKKIKKNNGNGIINYLLKYISFRFCFVKIIIVITLLQQLYYIL